MTLASLQFRATTTALRSSLWGGLGQAITVLVFVCLTRILIDRTYESTEPIHSTEPMSQLHGVVGLPMVALLSVSLICINIDSSSEADSHHAGELGQPIRVLRFLSLIRVLLNSSQ